MSKAKTIDVSRLQFVSKAFPTEADMKLWNSLDPAEQRVIIAQSEQAGFDSGIAPDESLEQRLKRVRAEAKRAL